MSLNAGTLISNAKAATFGAKGAQKVSDAALLQEINYQDQVLTQMASQIAPDLLALSTGVVATLSTNGNINGYTLQNGIHYRDFTHGDPSTSTYTPINVYQRQYREASPPNPSGSIRMNSQGAVFYPNDPDGKRWTGTSTPKWFKPGEHEVTYSYVPFPGVHTSLSATLVVPDIARPIIAASLEIIILMNNPQVNQAKIEMALAKRQAALQTYQFQLYKFVHPQGHRPSSESGGSDSAWVSGVVGG